jgi:hypothetical protein
MLKIKLALVLLILCCTVSLVGAACAAQNIEIGDSLII